MPNKVKIGLLGFLRENQDVFEWTAADIQGIDPKIISYHLNANPIYKPVRQKKRLFAIERQKAINEKVNKLLDANFIREV